jgi:hypothetical protein
VGRRSRQRGARDQLRAPSATYAHPEHGELELRGSLSPATRREYADVLAGSGRPAATQEDAWQRGVEFLFERLAVRWEAAGVDYERQKELLGRFRMATGAERAWLRDALREHLAEHFPDVQAP